MPTPNLSDLIGLPEIKIIRVIKLPSFHWLVECEKMAKPEVCPRCATLSVTGYDFRTVEISDEPIRGNGVSLKIRKRRLWCKPCAKPFTEPIPGVLPRRRTTQRFRRGVAWAAENFSDLKRVKKAYRCSNDLVYRSLYEVLELRSRQRNDYPFPEEIGIDEHNMRRIRGRQGVRQFVTMLVDYKNKKLFDVVDGKAGAELKSALSEKEGRQNVKRVVIDMCDPYKKFIREFFPNAEIVADKFHVLRLITPDINTARKNITGDKRSNPVRRLLLRSAHRLEYFERSALHAWLDLNPEVRELYQFKESLHAFYRIKGFDRAKRAFNFLTDRMALSQLPQIQRLRKTLMRWRTEILNYFRFGITNARTEGFNNVAKVIKRRSYGFRSFKNYRLRLLAACS